MIVAVTGLRSEAAIARAMGLTAVSGGGDQVRTAAAIASAIAGGAHGLVSFGIAGGLAPDAEPGTLILADYVVIETGERFMPPPVAPPGDRFRRGAVFGGAAIVATAAAKQAIHARTGALAVDLESGLVGRSAMAAGLPWAVIRAVADAACRDLPPAALIGLRPDGSPDLAAVLLSLLRRPGQLPALIGVARDSAAAHRALRRAAPALRFLLEKN